MSTSSSSPHTRPGRTRRSRPSSVLATLALVATLAALVSTDSRAHALSTGAIRPGDKPLSLTPADATCPTATSPPSKFPLFPLPQAKVAYTLTLTPKDQQTTTSSDSSSSSSSSKNRALEIKLPAQLLQADFNSVALPSDAQAGATRWVDPTNLLEFVSRFPTLLRSPAAQLPDAIPVDRATQVFADTLAEIFDAKGHDHAAASTITSSSGNVAAPKVVGPSNVWQVAVLASDQASDLFERTDKPKASAAGTNPEILKANPFSDKRPINVLKVVEQVRDRAEAARQRLLANPDTAPMQRAFERIDGIGYLFSNFREPQWGNAAVNSYAMSLRDFARSIDRHLLKLQGKPDEPAGGYKITHKYKVTTTTTNVDKINVLERTFATPKSQLTGAFGIWQHQVTSPVNQLTNPAVVGGPVRTNKLDGCTLDLVEFNVYANGNKMMPVPYKGPKAFATTDPVPQHVYRWTVPDTDSAAATASRNLQKTILESARSTKQLQWTLEAIATTEPTAGCPRVPVVPFVVTGVHPCTPPLKDVTPPAPATASPSPSPTQDAGKPPSPPEAPHPSPTGNAPSSPPNPADVAAAKENVAKCHTRCSAGCRARCEDMCEDRCEDRYGLRAGVRCSSCTSPCAQNDPSMRRACALGAAPQFAVQEEAEAEYALGQEDSAEEDAGVDDQDASLDQDAFEEVDFSLDDLVDQDSVDEDAAEFAAQDALDDEAGADEQDFALADQDLDDLADDNVDFSLDDLVDEDAFDQDAAEEFALGDDLADFLDEDALEDDA